MKCLLPNTMIRKMEVESGLAAYSDNPAILISLFFALMVSFILVLPVTSFADASLDQYAKESGMKLTTGVVNISTGWVEIFSKPYVVDVEAGPIDVLSLGPLVGLWNVVLRTGSGVYDTATFLFPFSDKYRAIMEPEFVWQDLEPSRK